MTTRRYAVEGIGSKWHELVDEVDGWIDLIRFTVDEGAQAEGVRPKLDRLDRAIADALSEDHGSRSVQGAG